jgi:kexin
MRRQITHDLDGVLWSEKQQLRHRHVKRVPPPPTDHIRVRQDSTNDQAQQEAIQRLNSIAETLDIKDPIFKEQWHLFNSIQLGHDLNVTGVWLEGITGNGTTSAVIDDGLDLNSNDLKDNYFAEGSWDFNDPGPEPLPRLFDDKHGTRCAGEIAAARNDVCGVGMAYDSKIAGIRILSKPISDEDEATAINYHYQENDIYSCSWGPPDDGQTMESPGLLIQQAMVNGVQNGRNGLGSVFVFAAGNGAALDDNCNFDGYTNSIYSITVGGIDRAGNHPYYSESCSAQLVVTYSSGHSDAIHTTDVGENKCYDGHGGTSAAGPLVVGVVALALSARPDLTWRDLQYLCVETSIPIHEDDGSWQDTTIGKRFSHMYGYGKVDAYRFVEAAKSWDLVKPQAWFHSPWISVQHKIPEGDQGLAASFEVTEDMLKNANVARLEHVTVTMNIEHTRRGDLSADLISPSGLVSHLATNRAHDTAPEGYDDWTFMSVVHW